ncbi:hypothetical protein CF319_g9015 [Tilletia indica]|nr:hypothetical protein CF319_g9015 [Tilletia indica]
MIDRYGCSPAALPSPSRYSSVRRQFRNPNSSSKADSERAVISYPLLNRKLIPKLAQSYVLVLAVRRMQVFYGKLSVVRIAREGQHDSFGEYVGGSEVKEHGAHCGDHSNFHDHS